jgi:hypothetical protein
MHGYSTSLNNDFNLSAGVQKVWRGNEISNRRPA